MNMTISFAVDIKVGYTASILEDRDRIPNDF